MHTLLFFMPFQTVALFIYHFMMYLTSYGFIQISKGEKERRKQIKATRHGASQVETRQQIYSLRRRNSTPTRTIDQLYDPVQRIIVFKRNVSFKPVKNTYVIPLRYYAGIFCRFATTSYA